MNDYCRAISELWLVLNPHCQVHGCLIDDAGTVHIWIWYLRNKHEQPLELVLGNPPQSVIRGFKKAINEEARARRLSVVTGSSRVEADMPSMSSDRIV